MPFFRRSSSGKEKQKSQDQLSSSLTENLERIKQKTGNSSDITIRPLKISGTPNMNGALIFVGGVL